MTIISGHQRVRAAKELGMLRCNSILDIKSVAFTGSYNDLSDTPDSLKNPNVLNIKFNGTSQVSYDGSVAKEINLTPSVIGAVNTSTILTTKEQISANTNEFNITGALAAKAMIADYNNQIAQLNSNLTDKLTNKGFYVAQSPDGSRVSINDMINPGIYRFYVNPNTDNANYLGWTGRTIILCTGDCAGFMHQIFFCADTGHSAIRRNRVQGEIVFDYAVGLYHIDTKSDIARLESRIKALENLIN